MVRLVTGFLILVFSISATAQAVEVQGREIPAAQSASESALPQNTEQQEPGHLELAWNKSVEKYLDYYCGPARISFQKWLDNSVRVLPLMKSIFREENLPEELVYVAMIESGFSPNAVSRAKAAGPWQLMPATAREYGLRSDLWRDERKDPVKSTRAAARILKDLHESLNSWPLVLAAYNAGIGTVQRALTETRVDDFWDLKKRRLLALESRNYVPKFMAAARIAMDPARYGFRVSAAAVRESDEVVLGESADLALIAALTGTSYRRIKALNPEINGRFTPPGDPLYVVNVPRGSVKRYAARAAALSTVSKRAHLSFLPLPIRNTSKEAGLGTCSFPGLIPNRMNREPESAALADLSLRVPVSLKPANPVGRILALCDRP